MKKGKMQAFERQVSNGVSLKLEKSKRGLALHLKVHEISLTEKELNRVTKTLEEYCNRNYGTAEDLENLISNRFPEGISLGDRIRAYRLREGLTQKKLSEISGIPRPHISQIEKDDRKIGLGIARKLARALDCDLFKILE